MVRSWVDLLYAPILNARDFWRRFPETYNAGSVLRALVLLYLLFVAAAALVVSSPLPKSTATFSHWTVSHWKVALLGVPSIYLAVGAAHFLAALAVFLIFLAALRWANGERLPFSNGYYCASLLVVSSLPEVCFFPLMNRLTLLSFGLSGLTASILVLGLSLSLRSQGQKDLRWLRSLLAMVLPTAASFFFFPVFSLFATAKGVVWVSQVISVLRTP